MVEKDEESHIQYTIRSPLNEISHPARPKSDVYRTEQNIPLKETVGGKSVAAVPPKQEPAPALVAPVTQPTAVVAVPQQAAEPPQVPAVEKPAEEKPAKHEGKPKEHTKKEKKAEGA
jgi:hypothetical protein